MLKVTLYNQTSEVSNAEAVDWAYALNHQANQHICPAWGLRAVHVVAANKGVPATPAFDNWPLYLQDTIDVSGALGFHDVASGVPIMRIDVKLCLQDGVPPSTCASHELAEALVDSSVDKLEDDGKGKAWALEVGDPVQRDSYNIAGASGKDVPVSNFAWPALFSQNIPGQLDQMGTAGAKFGGSAGGYMQWTSDMQNWHSVGEDAMAGKIARPSRASLIDIPTPPPEM